MDWILPDLAIGDLEDVFSERLSVAGVRGVLTVSDFPDLRHREFAWRRVPLLDGSGNTCHRILDAVDHLADLHREAAPVLVHCAEGKSRSVLVVTLYLARLQGLDFDAAYRDVSLRRPVAHIDRALRLQGEHILATSQHDACGAWLAEPARRLS